MVQLRGRTKSLFSTMKKLLRLDEFSRGGRDRGEVFDLLGLRVIVSHSSSASSEDGEAVAAQVSQLGLHSPSVLPKAYRDSRTCGH